MNKMDALVEVMNDPDASVVLMGMLRDLEYKRTSNPITYFFKDDGRRATAGVTMMIRYEVVDTDTHGLKKWVPRYINAMAMASRMM